MLRHRQLCLALLCLGLSSFVALVILQHQLDDFMRPLSDLNLGKPDKDFAEWWSGECFSYGLRSAGGDCPHFAKWTVREAAGKRRHWYPLHGVTEVRFTGKLLDGTVFASSREYGTLMFTPAEDDVMIGFSLAIRSMKPGEKAVFIVAADLARTWDRRPTSIPWNIPPDQTLCFDIELISITIDILDNGGVLKKIIKFGGEEYKHPGDLDDVFVNYNARLKDGTSVSKSEGVASQPPVSTPAAAAGPQPQRPVASATPAVGSSSSSSVTPLEASVEAKLSTLREQLPQWRDQPFTVFRVPAYVRESNPTAYKPRMVSIGPYYHGDDALRAMEDHKWRYLHDLLSRSPAVSSSLLIQEMRSMKSRALACYSERPAMDDDEFVRMLLLDGSFILEFFFKWHYRMTDPLCDASWGRTLITSDLLLLENQIPFFVVEKLYDVVAGAHGGNRETLFNLFLEYIGIRQGATPSATSEIHHLLHLLYESVVPTRSAGSSEVRVIPRAAEMSAAGVTFVARSSDRGMHDYDVTFDASRGVMVIPVVEVDDMNRPLLINLIAFEQSQGGEEARVVMSYVNLMSMIVRTAEDVALLRRCGILVNLLADDEAAAQFFSHLGDGSAMNYKRQVFSVLYHDVDRYCGSWWHRNVAALRRDYFGSPWSAISFVVAVLAVSLTATQTYFTVFPLSSK